MCYDKKTPKSFSLALTVPCGRQVVAASSQRSGEIALPVRRARVSAQQELRLKNDQTFGSNYQQI